MNKLKNLEKIDRGSIFLIAEKSTEYMKTDIEIMKLLCNKKAMSGVYVTINRPYDALIKIFNQNKINTKNLLFVDAITKNIENRVIKTKDCVFIDSPTDLVDISLAIQQMVNLSKGNRKFLLLDSVTTMLLYNKAGTVAKFAHFITNKIREWDINGVLIVLEIESEKELIKELSQFCDETIEM